MEPQQAQSRPTRRALIIDDDVSFCRLVTRLVSDLGYEAKTSCQLNPSDFAELGALDVIFVDMMMPGTDGVQALEVLSRNQVKSAIVLMSGSYAEVLTTAETIAKRQGLRVAGRLKKPFRSHELRTILDEVPHEKQRSPRSSHSSEMNVEGLLEGLERKEFDVYLQPIVDLATRAPVGYEALARWQSERFSFMTPDRFIGVAARNGLLPRLSHQVISRALGYAELLRDRGLVWNMSVNVGAEDFVDQSLPEELAELVAKHNLPSGSLTLELTESSAPSNETRMFEILARARLKGIKLAIDDFGTSYSGLERLSVIPFTSLKIDMRFISEMMTNENARSIVQSSIRLAKSLNIHSVAEGIETETQLELLRMLGCDQGQGYLFAHPMKLDNALDWASQSAGLNHQPRTAN